MVTMTARMYCRSCCYELTGLDDPAVVAEAGTSLSLRCPECGRGYRPADARSWQTLPRTPAMQFLFGRGGAWFVAGIMVALAFWQTWLPRPDAFDISLPPSMQSWTMWRWFGMRFGREVDRLRNPSIAVWYVADSPTSITAYDDTGEATWDITQLEGGRVRVRLLQPGLTPQQLIGWLASLQSWPRERFNLARPNNRLRVSAGTGEFEGTWQELLPAMLAHFNRRLVPVLVSSEQDMVVAIDPATGLGALVPVEQARALGFAVRDLSDEPPGMRIGL